MNYPKINAAKAINNHIILVEFENSAKKIYDVMPLLEKEMFSPLKNAHFFAIFKLKKMVMQFFGTKKLI